MSCKHAVMQDQPLQGALWCFEESLRRSRVASRAGVSARRELGWVLTRDECTPTAFLGKMMSCKHVFTPDNLLMYLSITAHTDFSLNLKPRLCNVQMSRIRLKTK